MINQRQGLGHKRIRDAGALKNNRALRMTMHGTQTVNALRGQRGRGQTKRGAIQHHFRRAGDERRDDRRPFRERGRNEKPDFLRIPRRQRDHGAERKIILE